MKRQENTSELNLIHIAIYRQNGELKYFHLEFGNILFVKSID